MCTMLLTSFARRNGADYLTYSLSAPLNASLVQLEDCEIDPSKIFLETPEEVAAKLEQNTLNLQQVADKLFTQILENQHVMPHSISRMSLFLSDMVEEIIQARSNTLALSGTTRPESLVPSALNIDSSHSVKLSLVREGARALSIKEDSPLSMSPPGEERNNSPQKLSTLENKTPLGTLTQSQKVVASFLFLRFFVPGSNI